LKNATIKAKDLRIRLQFEGLLAEVKIPDKVQLNHSARISSGPVSCDFQIAHAVFGDYPIKTETGRDGNTARLDVILYNGAEKDINFAEISDAVIIFALLLNTQGKAAAFTNLSSRNINHWAPGRMTATWHNMSLTIPSNPVKTSEQRSTAAAERNGRNPSKIPAPRQP